MAAGRLQPDAFSATYAITTAAGQSHWQGAVAMLRSHPEASAASWSAVLRAGQHEEEGWRRSLGLLAAMPSLSDGLRIDVVCCSATMRSCSQDVPEAWQAGLNCLRRMASAQIQQN
ncbi:petH, partial [Symbiodinium sp. CCMP2456]